MTKRVLVACGGEAAIRIARTLVDSGYEPLGIYMPTDRCALHRRFMVEDVEVSSYSDVEEIIYAATELGADAIHPCYGFLTKEESLASEALRRNIVFIGPQPGVYSITRDKIVLKNYAERMGIPTLPWIEVHEYKDIVEFAQSHGYPLILKPVAGKYGVGAVIINNEEQAKEAFRFSKSLVEKYFKDSRLYVEPFIERAKHIEVQVLGDRDTIIHLYDRECLVNSRFKRIIVEAPSPSLSREIRKKMYEYAVDIARGMRLINTAVVEFLYVPGEEKIYFVEVNPGLTPEHVATSILTRIDLVKKQLEVAFYGVHGLKQEEIPRDGHVIGVNIYAENPVTGEKTPGVVSNYREPGGVGVFVDSELSSGTRVEERELIAKIYVWGHERKATISRLERALKELIVEGIHTNKHYIDLAIKSNVFQEASYTVYSGQLYNSVINELNKIAELHAITLTTLVEFDDEGAKRYLKKSGLLATLMRSERVSSIKRSAWHYYIAFKHTVERHYSTWRKRREERKSK